jgi:hypothetical protein
VGAISAALADSSTFRHLVDAIARASLTSSVPAGGSQPSRSRLGSALGISQQQQVVRSLPVWEGCYPKDSSVSTTTLGEQLGVQDSIIGGREGLVPLPSSSMTPAAVDTSLWPRRRPLTPLPTRRCVKCVARRLPGILVSPGSAARGRPFRKFDSAAHLFPHVTLRVSGSSATTISGELCVPVTVNFCNPTPFPLVLVLKTDGSSPSASLAVLTLGDGSDVPSGVPYDAASAIAALLRDVGVDGDGQTLPHTRAGVSPAAPAAVVLRLPAATDAEVAGFETGKAGGPLPPLTASTAAPSPFSPAANAARLDTSNASAAVTTGQSKGRRSVAWLVRAAWEDAPSGIVTARSGAITTCDGWLRLPADRGRGGGSGPKYVQLCGALLTPDELALERSGLAELPPAVAAAGAALPAVFYVPVPVIPA